MKKKNVQKKNERPSLKYGLATMKAQVAFEIYIILLPVLAILLIALPYYMRSGFIYHNVALATNGNLTLSIFDIAIPTVSNAIFYVAPQNTGFNPVGFPTTVYKCYPSDVNLVSGQTIKLVCQIPSLDGSPVGTSFTGTIWMNFSKSPAEPAVFTEKIGAIVTKSS